MLTRTDESADDAPGVTSSTTRFFALDHTSMKSTATQTAAGQAGKVPSEYEALLVTAQAAQARADRAVADLAALKRSLSELPRTIESRRAEYERTRQLLEKLEAEMQEARQLVPVKQAEAARAIEEAANSQRALAHALIQDDTNLDAAQIQELTTASRPAPPAPPAPPVAQGPAPMAAPTFAEAAQSSALRRSETTAPYFSAANTPAAAAVPNGTFIQPSQGKRSSHVADEDVVAYMIDRDLLCPSCGAPLRGVKQTRCPGCRLSLSTSVMRSVAPGLFDAQPAVWAIRIIGLIAIGLALFLGMSVMGGGRPKGCGVGSDCHYVVSSPWSKIYGVPVSIPGVALYCGILVTTFFTRVGLRDVTRRRAWMLLCIAGAVTALAGVWFVVIQTVILKAFCPFCLTVDLMGILTGVVVLLKAPLGRREPLPSNAIGAIAFPRSLNLKLLATGMLVVLAFVGVHVMASGGKAVSKKDFSQQGQPEKKADDGLMMGGLEMRNRPSPRPTIDLVPKPDPKTPEPKKAEPKKTEPPVEKGGGLLVPPLEPGPDAKGK